MGTNLEIYKCTQLFVREAAASLTAKWSISNFFETYGDTSLLTKFPASKKNNQVFVQQLTWWDHGPSLKLLGTVLTWIKCCNKGRYSIIASNS